MVTVTLGVLTTTSQHIEGRTVREYLGIVGGEAVVVVRRQRRRPFQRMPEIGQDDLDCARQRALSVLARRASERGATVVLAVHIDYLALGIGRLLVIATGTAVRL